MKPDPHVLYILMRDDMASMTPGRACAQASHATSLFEKDALHPPLFQRVAEWRRGLFFGAAVVLAASEDDIRSIVGKIDEDSGVFWNLCYDPDYKVRDGDAIFKISALTCAYIFCKVSFKEKHFNHLNLF